MQKLVALCKVIDVVNLKLGRAVSWVTALLLLVVFVDVVMRYLFRTSYVFIQELEWHLFAFIFLMAAGFGLLKEKHVRVDIIYQRLGAKGRAWINLLGSVLFLFPGCLLIIVTAMPWVMDSFRVMETSPDPGGIPMRFLIKSCVPIGFGLLFLQGIPLVVRSYLIIRQGVDYGEMEE